MLPDDITVLPDEQREALGALDAASTCAAFDFAYARPWCYPVDSDNYRAANYPRCAPSDNYRAANVCTMASDNQVREIVLTPL